MSNDNLPNTRDEDIGKGAVEQNEPGQATNISRTGEMGHRNQDALIKSSDSDFPEPGQNEEHTGEPQGPQPAPARYRYHLSGWQTSATGRSEAKSEQAKE
jgi:hypothetical protein